MILNSIILENYRPYIGPEKIIFAEGVKNITIIQGRNDSGKTSLLNAFTWCFYGKEYFKKRGREPVYNKTALNNIDEGQKLTVKITIEMKDNNNHSIRFIRSQDFLKNNLDKATEFKSDFSIFKEDENGDEYEILIPENFIESNLPEDLREYFLFDGELLIDFFDNDDKSTSIKRGVKTLSQLDLLEKLKKHMNSRIGEFNKKIREINPKLGEYSTELSSLKNQKLEDEETLENTKEDIKKYSKLKSTYESQIKEFGSKPKQIQEEIDNINFEMEILSKDIKKDKKDLTKFLIDNFYSILCFGDLNKFLQITKDLEIKKYIPAPIKKDFLEDLLNEKKCICGTVLTEDSECYKELYELYKNTSDVTNFSDDVQKLRGKQEKTIAIYNHEFLDSLSNIHNNIESKQDEYDLKNQELKLLKSKLAKLPVDSINDLSNKIATCEKTLDDLYTKYYSIKANLDNLYPEKIKELEKLISKEESNQHELNSLKNKKDFCEKINNEVIEINRSVSLEIHDKLQEITSKQFKSIHWKESYSEVIIDSNFDVSIKKTDGTYIDATDPSSGTQLVLAFSFMIALNSLSGFKLPLIIDTPLSRLDEEVRQNLAEVLPVYLENKQMTLIVTDSEYRDNFKNKIKEYVGKEYVLEYHNENGEYTKVK